MENPSSELEKFNWAEGLEVGVGLIVGLMVGVNLAVGEAIGVLVMVGFWVGLGEATLPVTVAIGVISITGISVGIISSIIGVGVMVIFGVFKNRSNGEELILNTKKTPNTDKISKIMVRIKYLVFLESII